MDFFDYEMLSQEQKRAAFPEWFALCDEHEAIRRAIDAGKPARDEMSNKAYHRAGTAYRLNSEHRYNLVNVRKGLLSPDRIPPKAPPGVFRREWREQQIDLELVGDEEDCYPIGDEPL